MLFSFYDKTIKPVSIVLFYLLIGLLIAILIINNKLLDAANKNDDKKFNEILKTQKGLIWTNYSIITFFFLYLLIVSFYLFKPRFQQIHNRRKGIIIINVLIFSLIVVSTGLTYYINQSINEMNVLNAEDKLKKIYIIVPLISILAICLLMYNFSKTDQTLTYMNNYFTFYQSDNIPSITRNNSPTVTNLSDNDVDIPEYFRENLPNRYSPYFEENDI